MSGIEVTFTGDLQRVQAQPGDVFVLTCDAPMSDDTAARIRDHVQSILGAKILVMQKGMELKVFGDAPK